MLRQRGRDGGGGTHRTAPGTCEPVLETCSGQNEICTTFVGCGPAGTICSCFFTFEEGNQKGSHLCADRTDRFCDQHYGPCLDSSECDGGDICVSSCCNDFYGPGGVCVPRCGNPPTAARAGRGTRRGTADGPSLALP